MKIIRTKFMRILGKKAFTTPWAIYAAPKDNLLQVDINHESIHAEQWRELWYIGFLVWYVIEYLVHLIKLRSHKLAYKSISFEREAYQNDDNLQYLEKRKKFAFIKYIWYRS